MWPGTQVAVLSIAIFAAAVMSLLLARYVSSPIVRLQKASRSLAAGALDTRVGAPFTRRRDEVGTLARDFDAMAERIQALGHGERDAAARRLARAALAARAHPHGARARGAARRRASRSRISRASSARPSASTRWSAKS